MDKLLEGYRRFRRDTWPQYAARFADMAKHGQHPRALVLACSDSRADPAIIFDAAPGELFVIRNIANLVPPYAPDSAHHGTSAALEFGVRVLQVRDLIVMGHALCGGIHALLEGASEAAADFVLPWMQLAEPARRQALACTSVTDRRLTGEHAAVRLSLDNLMTFPWIAEPVRAGSLLLHGAFFDTESGELSMMDKTGNFVRVT